MSQSLLCPLVSKVLCVEMLMNWTPTAKTNRWISECSTVSSNDQAELAPLQEELPPYGLGPERSILAGLFWKATLVPRHGKHMCSTNVTEEAQATGGSALCKHVRVCCSVSLLRRLLRWGSTCPPPPVSSPACASGMASPTGKLLLFLLLSASNGQCHSGFYTS